MKKTILKILIGIFTAIGILLLYASTKPDTFRIERAIQIKSSPESIAVHITDFRRWKSWSPWEKLDSSMERIYSGAPNGKGAVYEWRGNSNAGSGSMEITDVSPSKIVIKLDFVTPFEGHNITEVGFRNENGTTTLTWAMFGKSSILSNFMGIFFDMDAILGKEFETGLQNLKTLSEQ